jgi:hypothetical protein
LLNRRKRLDVVQRLGSDGSTPVGFDPRAIQRAHQVRDRQWRKLAKDANLVLQ